MSHPEGTTAFDEDCIQCGKRHNAEESSHCADCERKAVPAHDKFEFEPAPTSSLTDEEILNEIYLCKERGQLNDNEMMRIIRIIESEAYQRGRDDANKTFASCHICHAEKKVYFTCANCKEDLIQRGRDDKEKEWRKRIGKNKE